MYLDQCLTAVGDPADSDRKYFKNVKANAIAARFDPSEFGDMRA